MLFSNLEVVNSNAAPSVDQAKPYEGPIVGYCEIQVQMSATRSNVKKCELGAENLSVKV